MKGVCFTIGYSNRKFDEFYGLLKASGVNCIIDVRSIPLSSNEADSVYNGDVIKEKLNKKGIYYIYMGQELGDRVEDKSLLNSEGIVDFDKLRESSVFKSGIKRILDGISKGFNIAIMCEEIDPIDGNRGILIGYELVKSRISLRHIIDENIIKTQEDIENELIKGYGVKLIKRVAQLSISSIMKNVDLEMNERDFKVEMIEEAYRMRYEEIGQKSR